jgi:UDP-4-amino-4-deoxy-L-arabinose-oxoglutarate aminotransferase
MVPHSRPWLGEQEQEAVAAVLRSGMLIGGEQTDRFRTSLSELLPVKGDIHVFASGRLALVAALTALNLAPGASVAVTTYACEAVLWSIRRAGLSPMLCDITAGWGVDPQIAADAVAHGCSAILLAPPFGTLQPASLFRGLSVPVVQDLCQASPATVSAASAEALGDLAVLSFHPTKYICCGGGGVVIDPLGRHADTLERTPSPAAPFTEVQAALGLAQLDQLDAIEARRSQILAAYGAARPDLWGRQAMRTLSDAPERLLRVPISVDPRDLRPLMSGFARLGVTARQGVDNLLHRNMSMPDKSFPAALHAFGTMLSLPYHPSLTDDEVECVVAAIKTIL